MVRVGKGEVHPLVTKKCVQLETKNNFKIPDIVMGVCRIGAYLYPLFFIIYINTKAREKCIKMIAWSGSVQRLSLVSRVVYNSILGMFICYCMMVYFFLNGGEITTTFGELWRRRKPEFCFARLIILFGLPKWFMYDICSFQLATFPCDIYIPWF